MFNTVPYNSFPASKAQFEEGKNDAIQAEIDAMKDGTNIDSFGDVETALATKTNLSNIAPTFDATSGVYAVGDKVIYNGVLYEFTTAHSTAGDWDSSEVQAVKVSELIDTLMSGLTNVVRIPTTSASSLGSIAGGSSDNFTPADDGFLAIYCGTSESQLTFSAVIRDSSVPQYGTFVNGTLPAYSVETIGGLFVKKGRTYNVRNSGENEITAYLCT